MLTAARVRPVQPSWCTYAAPQALCDQWRSGQSFREALRNMSYEQGVKLTAYGMIHGDRRARPAVRPRRPAVTPTPERGATLSSVQQWMES